MPKKGLFTEFFLLLLYRHYKYEETLALQPRSLRLSLPQGRVRVKSYFLMNFLPLMM